MTLYEEFHSAKLLEKPLLGAHRGNSSEYPENTIPAFESAIDLGCDLLECDIHVTRDGQLVVLHDDDLSRTTNSTGLVTDKTWAELSELDAGSWKGPQFEGVKIPLLSDVIALARNRNVYLAIEVKNKDGRMAAELEKLVKEIYSYTMEHNVAIVSSDIAVLNRIREIDPMLLTGLIYVGNPAGVQQILKSSRIDIFSPHFGLVTKELVDALHIVGIRVSTWPVDDLVALAWSKNAKVDAIFTNRPRYIRP